MEKTKWYESDPGRISAMRIGFMISNFCGALGVIFSIVYALLLFFTQRWEGIPIIITISSSSFGIMAMGDIVKNLQKRYEMRKTTEREEQCNKN